MSAKNYVIISFFVFLLKKIKIAVTKDDLYAVSGYLSLHKQVIGIGKDNEPEKWIKSIDFVIGNLYALCCCGKSENKPFCEGNHTEIGFNDLNESSKQS